MPMTQPRSVKPEPRRAILGYVFVRHLTSMGLLLILMGCANSNHPQQPPGILTVAVMGEIVLVGRAYPAGTAGTFSLQALEHRLNCSGNYRYEAFPSGRARYSCSDGTSGAMRIEADSQLSGRVNSLLRFPGDGKLRIEDGQVLLSRTEEASK